MADPAGKPLDTKKQVYGQAFGVYFLIEYYRATGQPEALRTAIALFRIIEERAADNRHGGYFEAFSREWQPIDDVRLTLSDMNEPKSMNTHLHILEAYTNLRRDWADALLATRLATLVDIFRTTIIDTQTSHLRLFFDEAWTATSGNISFGHDIEASWLLCEAAQVLDNPTLTKEIADLAVGMARVVHAEATDADGGVIFEADAQHRIVDDKKEWWVQCEAVIGYLNAWKLGREASFAVAALKTWDFIERYVIDTRHGECVRYVTRAGVPKRGEAIVNNWKCPYHNTRACLEIMARAAPGGKHGAVHAEGMVADESGLG